MSLKKYNFLAAVKNSRGQMEIGTMMIAIASLSMMAMASMWVNNIIKQSGKNREKVNQVRLMNYVSNAAFLSDACKKGFDLPGNLFTAPPPVGFVGLKFRVMNPVDTNAVLFEEGQTWNGLIINKLRIEKADMSQTAADYTLVSPAAPATPTKTRALIMSMKIASTVASDNTALPDATLTFLVTFEKDASGTKYQVSDCSSAGLPGGTVADNTTFQTNTAQSASDIAIQVVCTQLDFTWNTAAKTCTPKATANNKVCDLFVGASLDGTTCRMPASGGGTGGGGTGGGGTPPAGANLINVNFAIPPSPKTGPAAVGATGDKWNEYSFGWQGLANFTALKDSKNNATAVGISIKNAAGQWGNDTAPGFVTDPMFIGYVYPNGSGGYPGPDITVTLTGLTAGTYSFYLFGHGNANNQNTNFKVTVNGVSTINKATSATSNWNQAIFAENIQYVKHSGIVVTAGQSVIITASPAASGYSIFNGLQIAW